MHYVTLDTTGEQIPVGKILCLGKNYEKHAREMGGILPDAPVIFLKPPTAIIHNNEKIRLPRMSGNVHHELELVVVIGQAGYGISPDQAMDYVLGYAIGLDMTMRDVQNKVKERGEPWAVAKGFDTAAPLSSVVPRQRVRDPHDLQISLRINGEFRQHGSTGDMALRIPQIISYLSGIFTLERGDLIFTGTPDGVGPVHSGDKLRAEIEGHVALQVGVE